MHNPIAVATLTFSNFRGAVDVEFEMWQANFSIYVKKSKEVKLFSQNVMCASGLLISLLL